MLGDFNAHHPYWNCTSEDTAGRKLFDEQAMGNFAILFPPSPTHFPQQASYSPTTIDIIVSSSRHTIDKITAEAALDSDHCPVTCEIHGSAQEAFPSVPYDYRKANWREYSNFIEERLLYTSEEEIRNTIAVLSPFKAPGPDGIPNAMLKHLPVTATSCLALIFNGCMSIGYWPESFKLGKVIAIPTKGRQGPKASLQLQTDKPAEFRRQDF